MYVVERKAGLIDALRIPGITDTRVLTAPSTCRHPAEPGHKVAGRDAIADEAKGILTSRPGCARRASSGDSHDIETDVVRLAKHIFAVAQHLWRWQRIVVRACLLIPTAIEADSQPGR
jgi:hypothetical protein